MSNLFNEDGSGLSFTTSFRKLFVDLVIDGEETSLGKIIKSEDGTYEAIPLTEYEQGTVWQEEDRDQMGFANEYYAALYLVSVAAMYGQHSGVTNSDVRFIKKLVSSQIAAIAK